MENSFEKQIEIEIKTFMRNKFNPFFGENTENVIDDAITKLTNDFLRTHKNNLQNAQQKMENLQQKILFSESNDLFSKVQNLINSLDSPEAFFMNSYCLFIQTYCQICKENSFENLFNEYKDLIVEEACTQSFNTAKDKFATNYTIANSISKARHCFIEQRQDSQQAKLKLYTETFNDLNRTFSTLIDAFDEIYKFTEGNTTAIDYKNMILAALNDAEKEYIDYNRPQKPFPYPLIPSKFNVNKVKNIKIRFFDNDIYKIHDHTTSSIPKWIGRLYLEEKLHFILYLQKQLNTPFFDYWDEKIDIDIPNHFEHSVLELLEMESSQELKVYISTLACCLSGKQTSQTLLIQPSLNLRDLKKANWDIDCSEQTHECYEQYQKSSTGLEVAIRKAIHQNNEIALIEDHLKHEEFIDFLKRTLVIKITRDGTSSYGQPIFNYQIIPKPGYQTIFAQTQDKINKIFKFNACDLSRLDVIKKIGLYMSQSRKTSGKCELGLPPLLKKEDFSNPFDKVIIEALYFVEFFEEKFWKEPEFEKNIIDPLVKEMFDFEETQTKDHRTLNLVKTSFFSLTIIMNSNRKIREGVLTKLIEYALNFDSRFRQKQEAALMILTYYLYVANRNIPQELFKTIVSVCFEKHLYPFQILLYKEMMKNDMFFQEFPKKEFEKAIANDDPPRFYLLQGLCSKNEDPNSEASFLQESIKLQDQIWIYHDYFSTKTKTLVATQMQKIINKKAEKDYSSAVITGNNLCFLAFSDLADNKREPISQLLSKIECKYSPKGLLKAVIDTDFYQRKNNKAYNDHIDGINTDSSILLICGSTRMCNAYKFDAAKINVKLNPEKIKFYEKVLKWEQLETRYFFFLIRMLSHVVDNLRTHKFTIESITTIKEISKEDLESAYQKVSFLPYDNFPPTFEEFASEIPS